MLINQILAQQCLSLANNEGGSLGRDILVVGVRRGNSKSTLADLVASVADDERLGRVKVGNLAAVLLLLSVSESYRRGDLSLNGSRELLDGAVDEGRALRVSRHKDLGRRALCRGGGDLRGESPGLARGRAAGVEVAE